MGGAPQPLYRWCTQPSCFEILFLAMGGEWLLDGLCFFFVDGNFCEWYGASQAKGASEMYSIPRRGMRLNWQKQWLIPNSFHFVSGAPSTWTCSTRFIPQARSGHGRCKQLLFWAVSLFQYKASDKHVVMSKWRGAYHLFGKTLIGLVTVTLALTLTQWSAISQWLALVPCRGVESFSRLCGKLELLYESQAKIHRDAHTKFRPRSTGMPKILKPF